MLEKLKEAVCQANLDLVKEGLVIHTWGNVSGIDRAKGLVVIKPSGVAYDGMRPDDMVIVSLADGKTVESKLKPSSDTVTHLALYRAFPEIGGIAHTHSLYATAWAQAKKPIPALGCTQADYWFGEIPCTRLLTPREIKGPYEVNTGNAIIERFARIDYRQFPGALVASHGPFTWGKDPAEAVHNSVVLEFVAKLASETMRLEPNITAIQPELRERHFLRKRGPEKYYGQD
ncbi:MAG TPA: L-ribulose-5-phosphate 4-epimerase [Verrucomicrobiae bacterium]|jgi:L-ribulose-5-phosphate 4-epimerase|nr:L-ribulose-5-phosphate 4-epimerase [Verrucomicrobiae bacterium]